MTLKPLGDRIVIKVIDDAEKTQGGISFQILQKKNRKRAKLLLSAPVKL